ncbi:uncharacterized protein H6S33_007115 [Morchella sextelata]|uniref:uncharacterized protein n=1 Tax=Morchella sextelata TaxID=1174677 RepID=UPI001D03865A|nr:uncharacterized protein H6S33_007115 [Morchella sextelata]KAH0604084.1 hypothetical protein H6S33_007115 [Morchella sextelata]
MYRLYQFLSVHFRNLKARRWRGSSMAEGRLHVLRRVFELLPAISADNTNKKEEAIMKGSKHFDCIIILPPQSKNFSITDCLPPQVIPLRFYAFDVFKKRFREFVFPCTRRTACTDSKTPEKARMPIDRPQMFHIKQISCTPDLLAYLAYELYLPHSDPVQQFSTFRAFRTPRRIKTPKNITISSGLVFFHGRHRQAVEFDPHRNCSSLQNSLKTPNAAISDGRRLSLMIGLKGTLEFSTAFLFRSMAIDEHLDTSGYKDELKQGRERTQADSNGCEGGLKRGT